jgi:flagellar hook-associated protein 3 FlgL
MRISTTMMMDNYSKALESKYESIDKYSNQVSTTMAFERPSDDPVAAMQSIKACHDYTLNQQYQTSEQTASSWMTTTESTATEINDTLTSVQEKATEAANGTNSDSDMANYAVAMSNYRTEIVSALNSTSNGQYVFGESDSGKAPFQLDSNNNLQVYNYNKVADVTSKDTDNDGYVNVSSLTAADVASMKLSMPVDLGTDSSFDASTSGLATIISDYSGTGSTANNIVDQLTTAITANSSSGYSTLLTGVSGAQDAVSKVKTDIGEKSNMLTAISTRLTDSETNITSALANSMEADSAQAIMKYNTSETVYKESMSIASTVLQNSIFDFLK